MARPNVPIRVRMPSVTRTPFYYGWVILVMAGLATFASAPGQTYNFAVFVDSFSADLGLSSTSISSVYLVASLFAGAIVVIVGRALDRFGARVLLVTVSVILALGALWISGATSMAGLLVGIAITRSMGQGALSLVPATLVSLWFERRRASALAIMSVGNAVSAGVYPLYATFLLDTAGWRQAWVVIGLSTILLLTLPAALFVRRTPESIGLLPDGRPAEAEPTTRPIEEAGHPAGRASGPDGGHTMGEAARTRAFWLLQLATVSSAMIGTGMLFHQVSLLTDRGIGAGASAAVFAVLAPAMLVGQFVYGFAEGRMPARLLLVIGNLLMVPALALLMVATTPWQAYLYGAIFGLANGILINGRVAVLPMYFGRAHLGTIMGIATLLMMAAAAAGPLPLAISRDATGAYEAGIIAFIAILPLCALAAIVAGPPHAARD